MSGVVCNEGDFLTLALVGYQFINVSHVATACKEEVMAIWDINEVSEKGPYLRVGVSLRLSGVNKAEEFVGSSEVGNERNKGSLFRAIEFLSAGGFGKTNKIGVDMHHNAAVFQITGTQAFQNRVVYELSSSLASFRSFAVKFVVKNTSISVNEHQNKRVPL